MFERTKTINRQTKNNVNMQLTKSKVLGLLIATILFTSFIGYLAFSSPDISYTTVVQEGSMNIGVSYVVFRDSSTYYARNGETGVVTSSTNSTYLITYCIDNAENGTVSLQSAYYDLDSPIVITKSVKLIGSGHTNDLPAVQADYYPTVLYGTVLRSSSAINMIEIQGPVFNVEIRNIGIEFTGASTGHGIYIYNSNSPTGDSYGLTYGVLENIAVLNNDGSHYAYYFENIQHLSNTLLRSWGGPFLYILGNDYDCQYGNSIFYECYTYSYKTTSLPIMLINTTGTYQGNWTNLMTFDRLQLNVFGTSAPRVLYIHNGKLLSFIQCEIETDIVEVLKIDEHSSEITFLNPFFWSTNTTDSLIYADSDCRAITFIEGFYDIAKIQLRAVPNALINPHWTANYRPTFYEETNCILFQNYTIATQASDFNAAVGNGASYLDITLAATPNFNQPDTNYGVLATPTWNTTVYISNKATTGFRINFGTAAGASDYVDWFLFRTVK